jgi:hypothetical protein
MTKALEKKIDRTIRRKREELVSLREEVEDLIDYLDILEARARDAGKPRLPLFPPHLLATHGELLPPTLASALRARHIHACITVA